MRPPEGADRLPGLLRQVGHPLRVSSPSRGKGARRPMPREGSSRAPRGYAQGDRQGRGRPRAPRAPV
eukprot:7734578-Alexandrium_andersonii.AAC.1